MSYLIPAQYVDDRKVAGLRSHRDGLLFLRALREYFGNRKVRSITHGDIESYKIKRLATPTYKSTTRTIASVNRELELLRRILNVAYRESWILRNPFNTGDSLINKADERKRERIITREEEARLLAACTDKRAHLKPIIICALDTGMRSGEIFKLRWSDIDLVNRIITVRAFNTKMMRERQVAMTERMARQLELIYELSTKEPDTLCFGISDNVKKSFSSVRKEAGLSDVRFHDLRHTHATRLVSAHIPLSEVGRVLGHTQINTTYRYVNANAETARRAAAVLDSFNEFVNECEDATVN
jgi:integrase